MEIKQELGAAKAKFRIMRKLRLMMEKPRENKNPDNRMGYADALMEVADYIEEELD